MNYFAGRAIFVLAPLLVLPFLSMGGEGEGPSTPSNPLPSVPPDPATILSDPSQLSFQEYEKYRKVMLVLGSKDFDTRDDAMRRLVGRGPAILGLATEFAKNSNQALASQAQQLRGKVYLAFDGFLPPDPELKRRLQRSLELRTTVEEGCITALRRIAKEHGISILFDQRIRPLDRVVPGLTLRPTTEKVLCGLALASGCVLVVRGDCMVVTDTATAERLSRQRHNFDWKKLGLDRASAARVGDVLKNFFPAVDTELHTGSLAFTIRGKPSAIPKAARLLALLGKDHPAACFPRRIDAEKLAKVMAVLSKPASVRLAKDDFLHALLDFQKEGHRIRVVAEGHEFKPGKFPVQFHELSPVSLALRDIPLGLALRWLMSRTRFVEKDAQDKVLQFDVADDGVMELRVVPVVRDVLSLSVGGMDVGFLGAKEERGTERGDRAVRALIVNALGPQLALFPAFDLEQDLQVVRGRLLLQGSAATISWTLDAMEAWKEAERPAVKSWRVNLDRSLNKKIEWNGKGLSAGRLLKRLRSLGGFPILLEDGPDGEAAHFRLLPEQAELLKPGTYPLKTLLDNLAKKVHAKWLVKWGAVVLMPGPPESKEDSGKGKF